MKKLLLLLAFSLSAHAEVELGFGSITQHFWFNESVGPHYSGKINERGLIFNSLTSFAYIKDESKFTFFFGNNSVYLPMIGLKYTALIYRGDILETGFFWGGYWQDNKKFVEKSGIQPVMTIANIMPVVGFEVNIKLYEDKMGTKLSINNNLTPALSAHALTLTMDFP